MAEDGIKSIEAGERRRVVHSSGMLLLAIGLLLAAACGSRADAQAKDISGTWVAKRKSPMGEWEVAFILKVNDGQITGIQRDVLGDSPILAGRVHGDGFELTVQVAVLGSAETCVAKGKIVGDQLEIAPAIPEMPPVWTDMAPKGPGGDMIGRMIAMLGAPLIFTRGTLSPSPKAPPLDYAALPKFELPTLHEVGYNGLAGSPTMGWSSWEKFQLKIDDKTVREIADAVVESGMRDAGYAYVNIDDGWQGTRDERGVIRPNANFPDMKALADYVHGKGLKLGIYSSPGPRTCAGYEGSYGHELQDAQTWAGWGVDFLKYDWCSAAHIWPVEKMRATYQLMGDALRKTGRPIVYNLCQYGLGRVETWGPLVGANSWRTTTDVFDNWDWTANIGFSQSEYASYAGHGHWNDPDMLVVGNGGMSPMEYRTQFSLWAILAAPLIAGNDLRQMSKDTRDILTNAEVIAINQDPLGKAGRRVEKSGDTEIWAKPLHDNAFAVGLFNRGTAEATVQVLWSSLGVGGKVQVRDLWGHVDRGSFEEAFSSAVPPHGVVLIRVDPESRRGSRQ